MTTSTAHASDIKESLAQGLRDMVDQADSLLKSAARSGDERVEVLRDRLVGQVRQMRSQLDEFEDRAAFRARRAARSADRAVTSHPYSAIGIAAAAGVLIGLLWAHR
jgi:ElaB/YqjD/DUF883 family membrane-anchored ribosome-binding protein